MRSPRGSVNSEAVQGLPRSVAQPGRLRRSNKYNRRKGFKKDGAIHCDRSSQTKTVLMIGFSILESQVILVKSRLCGMNGRMRA